MVPSRPLLYLSLPGLALVLGLVWLRRRKIVQCDDTGGKPKKADTGQTTNTELTTPLTAQQQQSSSLSTKNNNRIFKHSQSLNISNNNSRVNKEGNGDSKLGKSAPIDIIPNGKTPPIILTDKQIDTEILKVKIRDSEYKTLKSIEEDFESVSSSVDLPDSVDNKKRFPYSQMGSVVQIEEPVVIKATTVAKISPKDSFFETAYTEECVQNATLTDLKVDIEEPPVEEMMMTTTATGNSSSCSSSISSSNTNSSSSTVVAAGAIVESNKSLVEETNKQKHSDDPKRTPPVSSPPLSLCSIQSGDSGKGSSPPQSVGSPNTPFDFFLPSNLVGQLIGRKGSYVNEIKSKTGATVIVRRHLLSNKMKICSIDGGDNEIRAALGMVRDRLPLRKYPNLTLQRIHFAIPQSIVPLTADEGSSLQLGLIEGINNDVIVSTVISGGHVFVQQPLHPSYPSLNLLQNCLNQIYSGETPLLPEIAINAICVASLTNSWYRVQIVDHNQDDNSCIVKFIDFGGYASIPPENLRQIRTDLMTIPFQAIECVLSDILPPAHETEWSQQSGQILRALTEGIVLQAQIAGYTKEEIPEILLFAAIAPDNVIFINQELVARNLARWVNVLTS